MLDAEISALQMLSSWYVLTVVQREMKVLSCWKENKVSSSIFQPVAVAALWCPVSVGAWDPVYLFFQNDQKGEGSIRKATAARKPENVPSSKDPFQADTHCCLAEICIVCVFGLCGCQNRNCTSFAWEHHCWHGLFALLAAAVHLLSGPTIRSLAPSLGVLAFPLF